MKTLNIFQKGWNYSQDGPGNRLVYHLQGCNMRCPWCSNPEGLSKDGVLMVTPEKLLDNICPHGAVYHQSVNRELCADCQTRECLSKNRNLGIKFSCREYLIDDLITEVKNSRAFFYDGGGVTLTGGEATLQFEAIRNFCSRLKTEKINTALETNGTYPRLFELFPLADTLIMDLKHYDGEIHRKITGVDNKVIIENINRAVQEGCNLLVRIPVIPGFNDSDNDARQFAGILKQFSTAKFFVELLAYHDYGKVKWEQCGMNYTFKIAGLPSGRLTANAAILQEYGLNIIHT
jgi:glycyl-radical enzyme activating protein